MKIYIIRIFLYDWRCHRKLRILIAPEDLSQSMENAFSFVLLLHFLLLMECYMNWNYWNYDLMLYLYLCLYWHNKFGLFPVLLLCKLVTICEFVDGDVWHLGDIYTHGTISNETFNLFSSILHLKLDETFEYSLKYDRRKPYFMMAGDF